MTAVLRSRRLHNSSLLHNPAIRGIFFVNQCTFPSKNRRGATNMVGRECPIEERCVFVARTYTNACKRDGTYTAAAKHAQTPNQNRRKLRLGVHISVLERLVRLLRHKILLPLQQSFSSPSVRPLYTLSFLSLFLSFSHRLLRTPVVFTPFFSFTAILLFAVSLSLVLVPSSAGSRALFAQHSNGCYILRDSRSPVHAACTNAIP